MALLENELFDTMLDAGVDRIDQLSLHTGDPNGTGANELTGGTYTRQAVGWNAADSGQVSISSSPAFDVPAANTIEYVGLWESGTSTFLGAIPLPSPESFANDGELTIQNMSITAINA